MTTITAQVEAIIDEIAPACVDCSEHVVANRLSAMRRLAERLYPIIEAAEARARLEGAKAMQRRAWDYCHHYGARSGILECAKIASAIAALDPAQIVKESQP